MKLLCTLPAADLRDGRDRHVGKTRRNFCLLGASSLQVCTAVMHYGFRLIEDLCDGLSNWMDAERVPQPLRT